jgi:hypothetical protein
MEIYITDEEQAELDALIILRAALVAERSRIVDMRMPSHQIEARLGEVNRRIKPLNVKLALQRNQDQHLARVTGGTHSQLMKMISLVTNLVKRGAALTPSEMERFQLIATTVGHTKATQWLANNLPKRKRRPHGH